MFLVRSLFKSFFIFHIIEGLSVYCIELDRLALKLLAGVLE